MKYRCKICSSVIDKNSEEISECPMCYAPKEMLELWTNEEEQPQIYQNAVLFSSNNLGISKDHSKCIDCGICRETCQKVCHLNFSKEKRECLSCGQCILTCPTAALSVKNDIEVVQNAMANGKVVVCFTSPAVRTSIGEAFQEKGYFQKKLVSLLKELGFSYVFDTTFGADLTIMEEATELLNRIENKESLPLITSCCPAWIQYMEQNFSELIPYVSTTKSPIGMEGIMIKEYWCQKMHLPKEKVFAVAITPCTAKKYEIKRDEIKGTDVVLTISEVISWAKKEQISWSALEESSFDSIFEEGSGGGVLFGRSGGVMESALRTLYYLKKEKDLEVEDFPLCSGLEPVKDITLHMFETPIRVLIINGLSHAIPYLEEIKEKKSPYTFIEIMNCEGGCIGGGGEPKNSNQEQILEQRMAILNQCDQEKKIRFAHQNPDIKRIYDEFLIFPGSEIAKKYLHTTYHSREQGKE